MKKSTTFILLLALAIFAAAFAVEQNARAAPVNTTTEKNQAMPVLMPETKDCIVPKFRAYLRPPCIFPEITEVSLPKQEFNKNQRRFVRRITYPPEQRE